MSRKFPIIYAPDRDTFAGSTGGTSTGFSSASIAVDDAPTLQLDKTVW